MIDFSVIIPHFTRSNTRFLERVVNSIPDKDDIEVIIVDNSINKIPQNLFNDRLNTKIYFSDNRRGAGGARNVGIEHAHGKWVIFADADDYFTADAFDIFYEYVNSESEIIYFCIDGIYDDTKEKSDRGASCTNLVRNYLLNNIAEIKLRLSYFSPCAKMVSKILIDQYNLFFDEVVTSNDVYFSMLSGFYAKTIMAIDKVVYIATVSRGSLTQRMDYDAIFTRYTVVLRCNSFLKKHGLSEYQSSIMYYLYTAKNFGLKKFLNFVLQLFRYKQNPFIGISRWISTYFNYKNIIKKDGSYMVK